MDVSPEVLAEDERIRKLQESLDRERVERERSKAKQKVELAEVEAKARELGIWDRRRERIYTTVGKRLSKIDREKAAAQASEHWDEIMDVYVAGLRSGDEKHAKACADALKEMCIGKTGTQPPPDPKADSVMVVGGLSDLIPGLTDDDEEGDGY